MKSFVQEFSCFLNPNSEIDPQQFDDLLIFKFLILNL